MKKILLISLFLSLIIIYTGTEAVAFNSHEDITTEGLKAENISDLSSEMIEDGNEGQDNIFSPNFNNGAHHFDNCMIEQGISYINAQQNRVVLFAKDAPTDNDAKRKALEAFGELLHTAQDFYAHTNYVELFLANNPSSQPSDIPIVDWNALPSNLRSGYFFYHGILANEVTVDRKTAIEGLNEEGINGRFVQSPDELAKRRSTFEGALSYANDNSILVLHADLNKDKASSKEGKIVVPATGFNLFNYAYNLAVRETERQWRELEKAIRRTYPGNADEIINALLGHEDAN